MFLLGLIPLATSLTACGTPTPADPLVGSWTLSEQRFDPSAADHEGALAHLEALKRRRPDHPDVAMWSSAEGLSHAPVLEVTETELWVTVGGTRQGGSWVRRSATSGRTTSLEVTSGEGVRTAYEVTWLSEQHIRWRGSNNVSLRLRRITPPE